MQSYVRVSTHVQNERKITRAIELVKYGLPVELISFDHHEATPIKSIILCIVMLSHLSSFQCSLSIDGNP